MQPAETLSDAQLDAERAQIGAHKLSVRLATNLRPILVAMELAGEEWFRDSQGILCSGPRWKPGFIPAHRELMQMLRPQNIRLDELNLEAMERQRCRGDDGEIMRKFRHERNEDGSIRLQAQVKAG